jgi:hypothetical protein
MVVRENGIGLMGDFIPDDLIKIYFDNLFQGMDKITTS